MLQENVFAMAKQLYLRLMRLAVCHKELYFFGYTENVKHNYPLRNISFSFGHIIVIPDTHCDKWFLKCPFPH